MSEATDGMTTGERIAALQRGIVLFGRSAVAVLCFAAAACFAAEPSFEYPEVSIERTTYQGDDTYQVTVILRNRSTQIVVVNEDIRSFIVQTDILGRWHEVGLSRSGSEEQTVIPPHKERERTHNLHMPLTIPSLYRNGEGDINMKFTYRLRFASGSALKQHIHAGESSYWITPKTNFWILREGM